ncbi:MAG: hypothetical protein ABIX28_19065 [Vicinamibacterales bacterium]
MSDPRNVAHAKKVTQEKKHHGEDPAPDGAHAAQPGKKPAAAKPSSQPATAAAPHAPDVVEPSAPAPAALEGSLVVLTKLKELEFHSRTGLERLAELTLTVEDELKQKEMVGPLGEVYAAQNALQTKLTALIDSYKAECDRLQGASA